MRSLATLLWVGIVALAPLTAIGADDVQTIVLIRHGEKPAAGLGQLSCRGLNRALALPKVIADRFGRPDAVFAPDPAQAKPDHILSYDYVRPLATVEPTAIAFGLPVNTPFGYADTKRLAAELERGKYRHAVLLVAWEHVELVKLARQLMAENGGDPRQVPDWAYRDYDGMFVLRIRRDANGSHALFERQQENLDGQPEQCPGTAPQAQAASSAAASGEFSGSTPR